MGFASGAVSFRRYAVVGPHPKDADEKLIDKLSKHVLKETEYGVPDEVEYGWCGGRHVFDAHFSFEHNVFAEAVHFAMRVDTNKMPSELKKAYQLMEEDAAAQQNPSGFISKSQKREAREVVKRKIEEDLKTGKFRRSKIVPVLWDIPNHTLYTPASNAVMEKMHELFERTFGLALEPLSAGGLALRHLEGKSRKRDYEDVRPTRFVNGPEGESQQPEYPWVAKGPQPKDFLGNEFLLWLWHEVDAHDGVIKADKHDVALLIDKIIELDCAFGQTGKDSLRGDGPTRMPEARDALRSGKVPRKAGLVVETGGKQFVLSFNAESFGLSGAQLPEVEDAEDARVVFEERIGMLRELCGSIDALYHAFLKVRGSGAWEGHTSAMRRWILQNAKQIAAA